MCGIAGYFRLNHNRELDRDLITRMVNMIVHRGPDEFGLFRDADCVLGHARLSIIDLSTGQQPLANEDGTLWITFNGEIYNYVELRPELEKAGHKFRTKSDTEVIVHAYEQWGVDCVKRFNGQFAFAIYDKNKGSLFVARDRLGIRPVFYTIHDGVFYFASEIKSIFCQSSIPRRLDFKGLDEIFTWWTTSPPRTAFENINELEAGTLLEIKDGNIRKSAYWQMEFPDSYDNTRPLSDWAEELHELLVDSVRLRLRADVPVGGYLSGGLDSSATVALIKRFTDTKIETFSIAFQDKAYDESGYQNQMAEYLGTNHHQITCTYKDIAENFPGVIWHAERPILRTAPTPLMMLSGLVRQNDFKVVLTGEGADEIFGGYDIFKETLIRRFWARDPNSDWRASLLKRLYPTLPLSGARAKFYLQTFYKAGLADIDEYYFSHIPRINTTTKIKDYFTGEVKNQIGDHDSLGVFGSGLPDGFYRWHHLARAQYLEAKSLLSGYLLSSQGDRVAAANSVETRFPFLDHRVVEFGAKIPPRHKIFGLKEKYVLKKAMARELPKEIVDRVKQPYMAPDSNSFFQPDSPSYVREILSNRALESGGVFNPSFVTRLNAKCAKLSHAHLSFKDNMSIIGILSTQILIDQYIDNFKPAGKLGRDAFTTWHDEISETHAKVKKSGS
ncbi:MAG: asparagine synthase (glutamine-hydrolyzing) [candidate division Zixibacteria bacterium]|nr:asparagine synthase (glutamine-hydrolyzing) [candidate division Zixibacteria bacterium]